MVQQFLTKNPNYTSGRTITPKGVMVHSTGVNNPRVDRYVPIGENYSSYHWNNPDKEECVHAFLGIMPDGSLGIAQTLPWNRRAAHCGGSANNTHISFEICEDDTSKDYLEACYAKAAELTADLCMQYDLDPMEEGVVICHSEGHQMGIAGNHADVMHWFPVYGKSMDMFRADVAKIIDEKTNPLRFSDVPSDVYYAKAVETFRALDIIAGIGDNKFDPNNFMTRGQLCAVLYKFVEVYGLKPVNVEENGQ